MKTIFVEIRDLLLKNKLYFSLFAGILCFYLVVFYLHQTLPSERKMPTETQQKIDALLEEAPHKPQEIEARLSARPGLRRMVHLLMAAFIGALGVGLWLGASDIRGWFSREPLISERGHPLRITWTASDVAKVILLIFAGGILSDLFLAFLKMSWFRGIDPASLILTHTFLLDTITVFFIVLIVRKSGAGFRELSGFGFSEIPFREIWCAIRTYLVILPVFIGILLLLFYLAGALSYEPPPHPLAKVLLREETLPSWLIVSAIGIACVMGPVVEEIFFRGFFYPALRKYVGVGWAMLVTAALFAGVHDNTFSFLPILFLGVVLCYLYEKRKNLLVCMSFHMLHNTAFLVYFFLFKEVLLGSVP
ncbi:MAG: CPBP family intramembrane metalloprotease [Candidatus Omnitrophica bacterium]|nr:CPBP family intramembrane metalloprotease [Candidatus Omnitrophota bacterium]